MTFSGKSVVADQIKLRLVYNGSEWTLIQKTGVLIKKRHSMKREYHVTMKAEIGVCTKSRNTKDCPIPPEQRKSHGTEVPLELPERA